MIEFMIFIWVIGGVLTFGFRMSGEGEFTFAMYIGMALLMAVTWPFFLGGYIGESLNK